MCKGGRVVFAHWPHKIRHAVRSADASTIQLVRPGLSVEVLVQGQLARAVLCKQELMCISTLM